MTKSYSEQEYCTQLVPDGKRVGICNRIAVKDYHFCLEHTWKRIDQLEDELDHLHALIEQYDKIEEERKTL